MPFVDNRCYHGFLVGELFESDKPGVLLPGPEELFQLHQERIQAAPVQSGDGDGPVAAPGVTDPDEGDRVPLPEGGDEIALVVDQEARLLPQPQFVQNRVNLAELFLKAWVGGINYKYFQYDHVGQGSRQVGSTFKPIVYATAIQQLGKSPCDSIIDGPFMIHKGRHHVTEDWEPKNSDNKYRGMVTLKKALANSINTVSAKLIDQTGPEAVVELAHKLGIKSEIPVQPSIALGAVEISVQDMVAAYSTFANEGVYMKPQFITKIVDKNGVTIYEPTPESHDVLNKDIAFAVIKLLEGVTEGGSGERLRTQGGGAGDNRWTGYPYMFTNPIAGKTGTTQNQSDGWFMGMVPNLVTGVWVGCEDRSARFKSITYGQGATAALPIWGYFMKKCYADENLDISKQDFKRPDNLSIKVDCWSPTKVIDTTAEQNTEEFN